MPFQRAVVKKSSRPNEKILALYQRRNQLTEKIWFQEEKTLAEKALVFDGLGKLKYTVTFGSFKKAPEKSFPHEIEISIRNGMARFALHTDYFWTDFEVNPQAFTPNFKNTTLIDLDA